MQGGKAVLPSGTRLPSPPRQPRARGRPGTMRRLGTRPSPQGRRRRRGWLPAGSAAGWAAPGGSAIRGSPPPERRGWSCGGFAFGARRLLDIQQVLGAPCRTFCRDEVLPGNERRQQPVEVHFHTSRPSFSEDRTRDTHQDVHAYRWHTHLVEVPFLGEIGCGQIRQRRAEFAQGAIDGCGVGRVGADPEVQVFGVTRLGVLDQRTAADDQIGP